MITVSLLNLKGGVGKTTTALAMSSILTEKHSAKVLLIDNDIQANVTKHFDLFDYNLPSMEDVMREESVITQDIIRATNVVDVIPSNRNLDAACYDLMKNEDQEQNNKIANALKQVESDYDFCLIDCPPGIGQNVINALVASDLVIVPVKVDKNSLDGLQELDDIVKEIHAFNGRLQMFCLVTMFQNSTEIISGEETLFDSPYKVFNNHIRYSKKVNEATFFPEKELIEFSPRSSAAIDYKRFVDEFLGVVGWRE